MQVWLFEESAKWCCRLKATNLAGDSCRKAPSGMDQTVFDPPTDRIMVSALPRGRMSEASVSAQVWRDGYEVGSDAGASAGDEPRSKAVRTSSYRKAQAGLNEWENTAGRGTDTGRQVCLLENVWRKGLPDRNTMTQAPTRWWEWGRQQCRPHLSLGIIGLWLPPPPTLRSPL